MKKLSSNKAANRDKLRLGKETLRVLGSPELLRAAGGTNDTRYPCDTNTTKDPGDVFH